MTFVYLIWRGNLMVITKMVILIQHVLVGISIGWSGGWHIFQCINLVSPITMYCLRNEKIIQPIFCICLIDKYIDCNKLGICYCANWKISQTFFTIHQLFFLRKFCHFIVAQSMPQTIVFTRTQITPLNEQYERNRKNQSYALHLP